MKTMKNWLLTGLLFMVVTSVFSQQKITGIINDSEMNAGLPGVNVTVKGTTVGSVTDFDGKFSINTTATSGQLVISYIGFQTKTIAFSVANGKTLDLGKITLSAVQSDLEEIVIKTGVADIAKDRKTPVAVSTIKAAEIREKLGNQEFPEILKNTPSVYATKSGGGFGDSRVTIRGFDQKNIAVMINGVPVNDMENSAVYWSNWAGLSDVTSAMQVQRGLGSSKLAIASVGGTINVLTKSSDMKEGGTVSSSVANDNYLKLNAAYNTGVMKNGLSASVLLSTTSGIGYVDGTKFEGKNYYIAFGYKPNKKHDFQFTFTGAPQWHNQRTTGITIANYIKNGTDGEPSRRYNSDWGYLNGSEYSMKRNYYHKPVMSINWDWSINETTKLSTVVYGSWGRGGGSNGTGGIKGKNYLNLPRTANGLVDYDLIQAWNTGQITSQGTRTQTGGVFQNSFSSGSSTDLSTGISRINSVNSHDWYGGIIDLNKKLTSSLTLDFGIDARTYKGMHYTNISDLLGADNFIDKTSNVNNPNAIITNTYGSSPSLNPFFDASNQEKISFDNDGNVNWYGAFTQLEYAKDNLSAFVQAAVSQQGFKKVDRFTYLSSNPLAETGYENIIGYNAKGGVNYNVNKNHNVFVNAGYYSKQPFFNAVYPNNKSVVNGNLTNEKIIGFEGGYGFVSSIFSAKLNLYYTQWKDRYQRSNDVNPLNVGGYIDFSGITEVHSGVELEMNARISPRFKANGMLSVGNWEYKGNSTSNVYDVANNPFAGTATSTLYLDKVKVGDAAQTTAAIGASYEVLKRVTLDANYTYFDKLYARIAPASFTKEINDGSLMLPSYGLFDAGFSYKMLVGKDNNNSVNFRLNVNNLFDKIYIAESSTNQFTATEAEFNGNTGNGSGLNPSTGTKPYSSYADYQNRGVYNGTDVRNQVFFGFGRTWNFTLRYDF